MTQKKPAIVRKVAIKLWEQAGAKAYHDFDAEDNLIYVKQAEEILSVISEHNWKYGL